MLDEAACNFSPKVEFSVHGGSSQQVFELLNTLELIMQHPGFTGRGNRWWADPSSAGDPLELLEGGGAYTCFNWASGRVHPGEVHLRSQGEHRETYKHSTPAPSCCEATVLNHHTTHIHMLRKSGIWKIVHIIVHMRLVFHITTS